jgi:hypothetical protein
MDVVATRSGYEFRQVLLENGEQFFYVSSSKRPPLEHVSSPIVLLSERQRTNSLVGEKLSPQSDITVVGTEHLSGLVFIALSNGQKITEKSYRDLKSLLAALDSKAKVDAVLSHSKEAVVEHDRIDERFTIRARKSDFSPIQAQIIFSKGLVSLQMTVYYSAESWLFVNSFSVLADDYKYDSRRYTFKRDHSGGKIWEWIDILPAEKEVGLLKRVSSSQDATIRFRGAQYFSDKRLTPGQREGIKTIVSLFSALNK